MSPGVEAQVGENLVHLTGIQKWFGREHVLRGADLVVPRGEVVALLGRNGGGKSTLVRILLGLLARDLGQARVLGLDPEDLDPDARARMAVVTDQSGAWEGTSVRDEVGLHRRLRGGRWDEARAGELFARFEVPLGKRIGALSKGQQARLRIALALAADPELLVLDEPALGLDLFARLDLLEAIISTVERAGRAVLIVSHLLDDVERMADRVVFLRHGRCEVAGAVDDLRDRFRRVRLALGPGGAAALEAAVGGLLGARRVAAAEGDAPNERVVVLDGHDPALVDALEERSGARRVEVRKLTLRELYLEVLSGREEGAPAPDAAAGARA